MIAEHLAVSDTYNFLRTCRRFAEGLRDTIIRRDIKSNTYNSLAWACFLGDEKLAERCLANKADANAAFCSSVRSPDSPIPWFARDYDTKISDSDHFKIPVYPSVNPSTSKFRFIYRLPCSALSLATQRNHLGVMKLLLKYGADTLDKHHTPKLPTRTRRNSNDLDLYPHHSAISQVNSIAAAKILLDYGAAAHINHLGKVGFTPLEMILYQYKDARRDTEVPVTEHELFDLVKLLLENGASPRRVSGTAWMPYGGKSVKVPSGPLIASVLLGSQRIFNLILGSSPISDDNFSMPESECGNTLLIALGKPLRNSYKLSENCCSGKILEALIEAGISPTSCTCLGKSLLAYAISERSVEAIEILFKATAEVNTIHPQRMSAISEAVFTGCTPPLVEKLLELGADVNLPSFHAQGPTPLLLAASDNIEPDMFRTLLQRGAKKSGFYQATPGSPSESILQCLLRGWPATGAGAAVHGYSFSCLRYKFPVFPGGFLDQNRVEKLAYFMQKPLDKDLFMTENGKHILTWAVEELRGHTLNFAVHELAPYYKETMPTSPSEETPLLALFGETHRQDYLAFGALDETLRIVRRMVSYGIPVTAKSNGETVLHRVCRLRPMLPSRNEWDKVSEQAKETMFHRSEELLKLIDSRRRRRSDHRGTPESWEVRYDNLSVLEPVYTNIRLEGIIRIVDFLIKNGASLLDEDASGQTPLDNADLYSRLFNSLWDMTTLTERTEFKRRLETRASPKNGQQGGTAPGNLAEAGENGKA